MKICFTILTRHSISTFRFPSFFSTNKPRDYYKDVFFSTIAIHFHNRANASRLIWTWWQSKSSQPRGICEKIYLPYLSTLFFRIQCKHLYCHGFISALTLKQKLTNELFVNRFVERRRGARLSEKNGDVPRNTTSFLFTNLFRIFISCNFFIILLIPSFTFHLNWCNKKHNITQYNIIYSSHRYYPRFFKNFPTFHILKTHPPITYILSSLSILSILEQLPFHMFQNPKKKKRKKETTLLPLFSKISSFSRQGWSIHVTINLIKLHRIATRSKDARLLLFLLSAKIDAHP